MGQKFLGKFVFVFLEIGYDMGVIDCAKHAFILVKLSSSKDTKESVRNGCYDKEMFLVGFECLGNFL